MKKTHLYGAVAATMLLAPVTANVLAAEEGEVPSETVLETQNSEELSQETTLPEQKKDQEVEGLSDDVILSLEKRENSIDVGTSYERKELLDNRTNDSETLNSATPEIANLETDAVEDTSNEFFKNEENQLNNQTAISEINDSNNLDSQLQEQPIVKAEDIVIPEEPTLDTLVTVIKDEQDQMESSVRDYYLNSIIYAGVTDSLTPEHKWEVVDLFNESMIDWSQPMESYFGDFSKSIYLNVSEQIEEFNKKYNVNYGVEDGYRVLIGTMEFDSKNKKWILKEPAGGNGHDSYTITQAIREQKKEIENSVPSEKDLDSNYIKGEVIKKSPIIKILIDGVETVVPLTPEMLTISEYTSAQNYFKSIQVNLDVVKKFLNLNPDEYLGVQEHAGGQGYNSDKWAYLYTDVLNVVNLCRIYFINGKWDFNFNHGELDGNNKLQIVKKNIPGFQEVQKKLNSLKMHVVDINGGNEIMEMDLIPGSYEYHYDYDQYYVDNILEHAMKLRLYFYYTPYLEAYNKKLNMQYQLADCEGYRSNYIEMLLTLFDDGSWVYNMPESPKELLFFVQKAKTPSKPLYKVDYDQEGITLSGESTFDFEGERFVAKEVSTDLVKDPNLAKLENKVIYDLHFEDLEGNEVIHIGTYRIQIPVPQQLVGKKIALYHISDSGATMEIPYTITSDQKIEFETSMFSLFVIGTIADFGDQPQIPSDSKPSNNMKPADSVINFQQVSTSKVIRVESQLQYGALKTEIGLNQSGSAIRSSANTGTSLNIKATLVSFILSGFGIFGILKKERKRNK